MISLPIYLKYIANRYIKNVVLILFVFSIVTIIIESTVHLPGRSFQIMIYHLSATLFKRLELLVPLAFLVSTVSTLGSMQKDNEVTAFEVSGISKAKIAFPFFLVSLFACLCLYLNNQFILPKTTPWLLDELKNKALRSTSSDYEIRFLNDGSRIVYTLSEHQLEDLFWIKNHREIWHCEKIIFEEELPIGLYVDKLRKNDSGQFVKTSSFHKYALPNTFLKAKPKVEKKGSLSIVTLFKLITKPSLSLTSDKGFMYSLLCYKMISPWFPVMIITATIPYLLPYRKKIKTTNLYFFGTLSFFLFHALVKGCIVLAEHYVASPLLTIILLPFLLQGVLSFKLWTTLKSRPPLLIRKNLLKLFSSSA